MHNQPKINEVMRSILVDWLVEVHKKFRLVPETLYLCINILDRYLANVAVERGHLQLVGVTSLLLASKYEEIYPPEVKDCVYITDRTFTHQEILDMEAQILRELKFNLSVPTALPFLHRFLFLVHATSTVKHTSHFYLDRMLQELDFLKFRPSLLAMAVVCLAINHPEIREHDEAQDIKPGIVSPYSTILTIASCITDL
jgi:G2/mitotic-specific cyclin-B, other